MPGRAIFYGTFILEFKAYIRCTNVHMECNPDGAYYTVFHRNEHRTTLKICDKNVA